MSLKKEKMGNVQSVIKKFPQQPLGIGSLEKNGEKIGGSAQMENGSIRNHPKTSQLENCT